jgi:hypothetical protein
VAAARAAEEDRELVANQFAAAAAEGRAAVCSSTPGHYWLALAENHLTRRLFGSMSRLIDAPAVASRYEERGDTSVIMRTGKWSLETCL